MARQVITMLTDDLDGGEAADTVKFGFDGITYEIDLSEQNIAAMREFMSRYTNAGTRTGRMPANGISTGPAYPNRGNGRRVNGGGVDHPTFQANKELNNAIRTWAGDNGYDVAERGRIPQLVVDAYHKNAPAHRLQPELTIPGTEAAPVEELSPSKVSQPVRKATAPAKTAVPAVSFKPEKTAAPAAKTVRASRAKTTA